MYHPAMKDSGPEVTAVSGSGVATGGQGGQIVPLDSQKFAKTREKKEENQEKSEKRGENREKEEKSGRFFHFAPSDR